MTSRSYDLRERPWLPVRVGTGTQYVGLRELMTNAHEISDLAVPIPPAASGLWRILCAITARVTALDDASLSSIDWEKRRLAVLDRGRLDKDRVNAYLDRWADRFDLFDQTRPWLQDPRLRQQCPYPSKISKLVVDRPAGNTQVWFGHYRDDQPQPLPAMEAAWYLIAQLYYGPSGKCTPRTVAGTTESNLTAGPLRTTISYHPAGRTVFESLLAGIPHATEEPHSDAAPDRCPWEQDELPDPLGAPTAPTWPGALLTGRARHAVLLEPDAGGETVADAYLTWAWRQPSRDVDDPYLIMMRRKDKEGGWYARRADAERALWRDVDALLGYRDERNDKAPPIVASCVFLPFAEEIRIRSYGFDQDGQAKDNQWFTAITPPVLRWCVDNDETAYQRITDLRQTAEQVGWSLTRALREAWRALGNGGDRAVGPWPRRASAYYWPRAEERFWSLMDEPVVERPRSHFLSVALQAIEYAVGPQERLPRIAKAINEARRDLAGVRRKKESA